ncbi:MAG: nuclear transport factor 2 family protein [Polyangiaceae bacterium]
MSTIELAKRYVELVKEHKNEQCLSELFSPDAVSVEAGAPPGQERAARGVAAIREKSKWWNDNHTVHSAEVDGPYPHDDRFAVRFTYDVTFKPQNKRFTMNEIGLFTESKATRSSKKSSFIRCEQWNRHEACST